MCPLRDLLSLVSQEDGQVAEHLDDTLLNRLEEALYCEDVHHTVWSDFHDTTFRKLMSTFEGNLEDTEFSRGKLKIRFAILWRMRNYCQSSDFEVVTRVLNTLVMSKNCSMISTLHAFYQKSLYGLNSFHFFGDLPDSHLLTLKNLYQTSLNVNHRRSIMLLFILLSLSTFETHENVDKCCKYIRSTTICSHDVDFLVDFLTELVRVSNLSSEACSVYLNQCAENVAALVTKNSAAVKHEEELIYLSILLAPYQPTILEGAISVSPLSNVGDHLRRLLTNGVLQDCPLHRFLVSSWYSEMEASFGKSKATLAKALTPISTCRKNPLHHPAFRDLLPPTFTDNLWNYSIKLLPQNQFDNVFKNCWLLFNRYCHLQEDTRKREQLQFLLDQICNQPHILAEFSVLMDSVFLLYSSLPSVTLTERLSVFQRIYHLAHEECSRLKSSGGCLSYSFLLLRIYQSAFLNEAIALQLLQLQKLVSTQIAEECSLLANEMIIEMHCGFFITPLLEPQAREVFTPQIFTQVLDLVTTLQVAKASTSDEKIFPIEHLRATETLYLAMKTCADLGSAEWEEDPLIRTRVAECWSVFSEKAEKQLSSPEMRSLLERLRPHFSLTTPVHIGHGTCPSCGECIHGLLEDIVLSNQAVGDLDCVGD
ncbi:hypothetical protein TSMEX_009069 [Taenia solium]|eukprot:TsM_000263000 transcript=TsM_000263000 gene=TsM_000263000